MSGMDSSTHACRGARTHAYACTRTHAHTHDTPDLSWSRASCQAGAAALPGGPPEAGGGRVGATLARTELRRLSGPSCAPHFLAFI